MRSLAILVLLTASACGGNGKNDPPADSAPQVDAPITEPECFMNPQTHNEIINACTTAQKIRIEDLRGAPPLLNQDGTLPPLPN